MGYRKSEAAIHVYCLTDVCSETYLVFIALQCLAVPVGLLLSPPEKVQRSDGSKVKIVQEKSFGAEMRALIAASKRRDILLLLPVFWAAYFNQYSGSKCIDFDASKHRV